MDSRFTSIFKKRLFGKGYIPHTGHFFHLAIKKHNMPTKKSGLNKRKIGISDNGYVIFWVIVENTALCENIKKVYLSDNQYASAWALPFCHVVTHGL